MAIKIPSKNIYEMENPKIRDNPIDNVTIELSKVTEKYEKQVQVYENVIEDNEGVYDVYSSSFVSDFEYDFDQDGHEYGDTNKALWSETYALVRGKVYEKTINISFNELIKNAYIEKIYDKVDESDTPNIKLSILFDKIETDTDKDNATVSIKSYYGSSGALTNCELGSDFNTGTLYTKNTSNNGFSEDDLIITYKTSATNNHLIDVEAKVNFFKDWENEYFLNYANAEIKKENNNYSLTFKLITGIEYYKLGLARLQYSDSEKINQANTTKIGSLTGTYTFFFPKQIKTTFLGNSFGIDLTDVTITYIKDNNGETIQGSGNKPFSLERNELVQDSATNSGVLLTKHLAREILTQYKKGKETATLLCDINEYYDENGNLVISTKNYGLPMTFKIGDIVIPYVYGADGKDYPMSKYQNGQPKQFRVVGAKKIYDGAVWQELTLQEV